MSRTRMPARLALGCAALVLAAPASASAAWTEPQDVGRAAAGSAGAALASNARGDGVAVFSEGPGISVARASAGTPFGARRKISGIGDSPRVAIDARGVVLIAFEYNDETDRSGLEERFGEACCVATKVVVWRPGHAPSRPRHVRRRGLGTSAGPVAATRGRRGLLLNGSGARFEGSGSVQFVPVRLDGRPGKPRRVASPGWAAATLQFVGTRAVVGLIDHVGPATRLATRRQRRSGSFGTLKVFRRVPERLGYTSAVLNSHLNTVSMTPDGKGGQVAVWQRGQRGGFYLQVGRKRLNGRLRAVTIRRGAAFELVISAPAASPDGWVALAFTRHGEGAPSTSEAYVVALRPDGEAIVTSLGAGTKYEPAVASMTRGGAGAVGGLSFVSTPNSRLTNTITVTNFIPLVAGVPQPAQALVSRSNDLTYAVALLTSNPRDRARALWENDDRARLFASRLE